MQPISCRRHQFPPEIIRHVTWLRLRFTLRYRDAEEILAESGLDISHEMVRRWTLGFGLPLPVIVCASAQRLIRSCSVLLSFPWQSLRFGGLTSIKCVYEGILNSYVKHRGQSGKAA